jgi:hypothetical protein
MKRRGFLQSLLGVPIAIRALKSYPPKDIIEPVRDISSRIATNPQMYMTSVSSKLPTCYATYSLDFNKEVNKLNEYDWRNIR